ncbi:hypothetical protein EJ110_NYTH19812 [Nymphaea thermarum]|nr:hypothetical protein EJ110_NYTH19812 [Nymphaea thermarum]
MPTRCKVWWNLEDVASFLTQMAYSMVVSSSNLSKRETLQGVADRKPMLCVKLKCGPVEKNHLHVFYLLELEKRKAWKSVAGLDHDAGTWYNNWAGNFRST